MTTPRVQSETEKVLRQQCAGDDLELARLDRIFGEVLGALLALLESRRAA